MSSPLRSFAGLADDLPFLPLDPYERRWLQLSWRGALLIALTFGVYALTLSGGWLWQDDGLITDDLRLRSREGLAAIWASPFNGAEPPLTMTLWWAERVPARQSAIVFRLGSVAMHAASCVLLWLAMRRLSVSGAWLIAAVLAVHPIFIASVAWPSRQGPLLGMVLAAMALLAFLRARNVEPLDAGPGATEGMVEILLDEPAESPLAWAIAMICATLTLLADPATALVLSATLVGACWMRRLEIGRRVWIGVATLAAGAVLALVWEARHHVPPGEAWTNAEAVVHPAGRFVEAAIALPFTTLNALLPWRTPLMYDRTQWSGIILPLSALIGIAVLAVIAGLASLPTPRLRGAMVLALLIALAWVAHASIVLVPNPVAHVLITDLLVYGGAVAVIVLALSAGLNGLNRVLSPASRLGARWTLGVLLLGGLSGLTYGRAAPYAATESLWAEAIARNDRSLIAKEQFAAWYIANAQPEAAAEVLDRVDEAQRDVRWLLARARAFDAQGKPEDAIAACAVAWQRAPNQPEVTIALAEAQRRAGRPGAAILLYERFLERSPGNAAIQNNLGLAHFYSGEADAAIRAYEAAIVLDPAYVAARLNLANTLFEVGRFQESSNQLQKAVEIDPRSFPAFMNAGSMLYRLGEQKVAERMFRAAVMLDPESADAFDRLGITLAAQGNLREAVWCFTRASRLRPADLELKDRLARATQQLAQIAATQKSR